MTGRQKFLLTLFAVFAVFVSVIIVGTYKSYTNKNHHSIDLLFRRYNSFLKKNPETAKHILEMIIAEYPKNIAAQDELGKWYLAEGDIKSAIQVFKKIHQLNPSDREADLELFLLMHAFGMDKTAVFAAQHANRVPTFKHHVNQALLREMINEFLVNHLFKVGQVSNNKKVLSISKTLVVKAKIKVKHVTVRNKLLNQFYLNKNKNPPLAWQALNKLLASNPRDLQALKEAGYYAIKQKQNRLAFNYFKRAYAVSHDPKLALQNGYLLDGLQKKHAAYYYFDLATRNPNLSERLKAELAKTNLRAMQTQFLPSPYFADLYFDPFYHSRFRLMIYPIIVRLGAVINSTYRLTTYISYRRTSDNKSRHSGTLPQIYEDDAAIIALGIQATPFPKIPLNVLMEAGKATDLVYRNHSRTRNDFRSGLSFYDEWGKSARYTFYPNFSLTPNADLYADSIYFSRYTNIISTARFRPGLEFFRYGSMSFNFYYKVFISEDSNRLFYNNILETGPSIAFTPSDRYNIVFRYECLTGYYLPASSAGSPNPYGPRYHNNMVFMDLFLRM